MSYDKLITVIIPTFNRSSVLSRAIDSVLAQSYADFELIIVDDGSTDNTKELLKVYGPSLKSFYQENAGVSSARNLGVSMAQGKYIAFLDSDDSWEIDKLKIQIEFLQHNPIKTRLVHSNETWMRNGVHVNQLKKHKKGGGNQFIPSLDLCLISPSAVLMEKSLFNEMGGFREDYEVCEDYDLWLKITQQYELGFIHTPLVTKYGGHEDQLSCKYFAMDYWRIKSIDWILTHEGTKMSLAAHNASIDTLLRKGELLLKGYLKHDNMDNFDEIQVIVNRWLGPL